MSGQQVFKSDYPHPVIDFDETNDVAGKEVRACIPTWNVSSAELEAYRAGKYSPFVATFSELGVEKASQAMHLFKDCWEYLTPAGTDTVAQAKIHNTIIWLSRQRSKFWEEENTRILMDFVLANPEHELSRQIHNVRRCFSNEAAHAEEISHRFTAMIRCCLSPRFLLTLLAKIRELLKVTHPLEPTVDRKSLVTTNTAKVEHSPFRDSESALTALITCVHFILIDHYAFGFEDDYRSKGKDDLDKAGDLERRSHWSLLHRYLREDIAANGPAPEQLKFFYGCVELASRLEHSRWGKFTYPSSEAAMKMLPHLKHANQKLKTGYGNFWLKFERE